MTRLQVALSRATHAQAKVIWSLISGYVEDLEAAETPDDIMGTFLSTLDAAMATNTAEVAAAP